jgi:hypothetical protein
VAKRKLSRAEFEKLWFAEILAGQPCVTNVGKKITMVIAGKGTKAYHKIQARKVANGLNAAEDMLTILKFLNKTLRKKGHGSSKMCIGLTNVIRRAEGGQ